ncbi:hypothetical protein FE257_000083 [Aspergillus nanangensis]|uniref:Major facilitator superfamily (MFS) profile domain-containing protein n=1 Tax=Aspergillus nanangensis TaxID=2582783 RepID=A0AAD4GZP4_ASPNN|nr:hypothetical protein FE257_000083 [Aspergillus nanangensis]
MDHLVAGGMSSGEISTAEPTAFPEKRDGSDDGEKAATQTKVQTAEKEASPVPSYDGFKLGIRGRVIFFTLAVLTLMVSLDGTSISVALPQVAHELNGSAIEAFWTGTSFLLCSTVFQPGTATLSNIFGRRLLIMISLVFFLAGAVVASLAHNFTVMLAGRCIQGIGGGGLAMLAEIVVTDLVPLRLRGNYYGILSAMYAMGSVLGPIVGGGFAQSVTWRWIFYINFPFIGVGAILITFFFRLATPTGSLEDKLSRIDYVGTVLFIGSLSSFLIPLSWGGVMYDWDTWRTLAPLAIGAAGLSVFVVYERYVPEEPMIPQSVFQNRSAAIGFVSSGLQGMILWCGLYYMPFYFEAVRGFSPLLTGVALFPDTFTIAPAAIVCGVLISKTSRYRWCLWVGWMLATLGYGIVCLIQVHTSTAGWILLRIPGNIGMGMITAATVCTVQASATNKNLTVAVAMVVFFRAFGQAIGIAVGGVIFQNQMRHHLMQYADLAPSAGHLSKDAAAMVMVMKDMQEGPTKEHLKLAYTDSLRIIWAWMCALSGAGLAMSLFIEKYDLNQALVSELGLVDTRDDRIEEM